MACSFEPFRVYFEIDPWGRPRPADITRFVPQLRPPQVGAIGRLDRIDRFEELKKQIANKAAESRATASADAPALDRERSVYSMLVPPPPQPVTAKSATARRSTAMPNRVDLIRRLLVVGLGDDTPFRPARIAPNRVAEAPP